VDTLWAEELRAHPTRFDGTLLSYAGRNGDVLRGRFVAYRDYVAQRRDPALAPQLEVVPLAVCGLLVCDGDVAWARRSDETTQYPGRWETVPAGGIDAAQLREGGIVDYEGQLLRELTEETGIEPARVVHTRPLAVLHDRCDEVIDIATLIEVSAECRPIASAAVERRGSEHRSLIWVPIADLVDFMERSEPIVPGSRALCELFLKQR
jgi:8-oxo-dGTP pyrophosphatase MutT (NUDIX family)